MIINCKRIRIVNYFLSGFLLLLVLFSCAQITYAISHTWSELGDVAITVAQGGTGASTLTAENVILGNSTSAVTFVAPSTDDNVLKSDGSTWTSAAPTGTILMGARAAFSGTTYCHPIQGTCGSSGSTIGVEVPFAGTIKNLKVITSTAPNVGSSLTGTIRKATLCSGTFANTALTCTLTGDGSTKSCTDASNSVSISANDCLQFMSGSTGTVSTVNSFTFQYAY
jgi:hypothetical protein